MESALFTVFANFRIQSPDRLERLATCLAHLARARAQAWVFNIRGEMRNEAAALIRQMAPGPVHLSHLESEAGWFRDTLQVLEQVRSEFVVFVVEDHFLVANPLTLECTVQEMHDLRIDHLEYSWFPRVSPRALLQGMPAFEGAFTVGADLDLGANAQRHRNYESQLGYSGSVYIVSLCSIARTDFFRKVCRAHHADRRRFDVRAPFDAERSGCDVDLLPIRIAHPKIELFAALDDENIHPGSSLHQRGLYRDLSRRAQIQQNEGDHNWQYRDLHFSLTPPLTRLERCQLHVRIYRYVERLMAFQAHYQTIAATQLGVMAEAFKQVEGLESLIDYESLGGSVSLFFLKAFGGSWAQFRAKDDCEAVRAHENLFGNRLHAGYRAEFLTQRVRTGQAAQVEGFWIHADYTPFGPHCAPTAVDPATLVYVDMTALPAEALLLRLREDLDRPEVRAVMSDSVVPPDAPWSMPGAVLNHMLTERGFELLLANEYQVPPADGVADAGPHRRCTLYCRAQGRAAL
jgi:hypothetical protein